MVHFNLNLETNNKRDIIICGEWNYMADSTLYTGTALRETLKSFIKISTHQSYSVRQNAVRVRLNTLLVWDSWINLGMFNFIFFFFFFLIIILILSFIHSSIEFSIVPLIHFHSLSVLFLYPSLSPLFSNH